MPAFSRKFVLGLAVLLAAATAAADAVVTAKEIISCRVVSADTNFVRLELSEGGIRMLYSRDVLEIRLSDSSRVAELAAQLPQVKVTPDSARPAPPPSVPASSLPGHAGVIDTLARNASPAAMTARCRDMYAVLRECGRSNDTVFDLFREVDQEQEALRRIRPQMVKPYILYLPIAGLLGGGIGSSISFAIAPCDPSPVGPTVGCVAGSVIGAVIGARQNADLIARHRKQVNDLVRRVNRAVASPP